MGYSLTNSSSFSAAATDPLAVHRRDRVQGPGPRVPAGRNASGDLGPPAAHAA
jgi:hypothetical protein